MKTKRLKRYLSKQIYVSYSFVEMGVDGETPFRYEGISHTTILLKGKGRLSELDLQCIEQMIIDGSNYRSVNVIGYTFL